MRIKTLSAITVLLLMAASVWADEPKYDTTRVITFTGEVVDTGNGGVSGLLGMNYDWQITVRNATQSLSVILGPKSYTDTQNYKPEKGEQVTVTGSKVLIDQKPTIIAEKVQRGNDVLQLRSADGTPLWQHLPKPTTAP